MEKQDCIKASILFLFISFFTLTFAQFPNYDDSPTSSYLAQNISSQIVQERESLQLFLDDYFKGSLLSYKLCIANRSISTVSSDFDPCDDQLIDPDIASMIRLEKPYEVLNSTQINSTSFKYGLPPFPRSTFLMEDEDGTQVIYFVDRNYMFMRYDINNYTEKQTVRTYSFPLNTTILNDTCSDLQRVSQFTDDYLIMFCQTVTFQDNAFGLSERVVLTTIVRYEGLSDPTQSPMVRYLSYNPTEVLIDPNVQLTNLGCEFKILSSQQTCMYLSVASIQTRHYERLPVIIKVNISEFEDMKSLQQTYRVLTDREPVKPKYTIVVPKRLRGMHITDAELLGISYYSRDYPWLAVLVQSKSIAFCQYSYLSVIVNEADDQQMTCLNGTVIDYANIGYMYHNEKDKSYLYASLVSPPGVVEIRVDDPPNAYINRVYKVGEDGYARYIGQPVIATNDDYILHLMIDMLTLDSVIRVYDKKSNYYSTAMFDYKLPKGSRTNYFVFPSLFLDIIFYRDEEFVSLVRMSQDRLILDATDSDKVRGLITRRNHEVVVGLSATNNNGNASEALLTLFNVTFVDKDDTHIYSIQKDQVDQRILYNCGDNRFSFAINGYFNGPNYELSPAGNIGNNDSFFNFTRKDMNQNFLASFNFSECQDSYSLTAVEDDKWHMHGDLILICINKVRSEISTYSYDAINNNLTQTNVISMPMTQFLGAAIDMDMRMLILFTNTTYCLYATESWIDAQMTVHIFAVENSVIWKANTTINSGLMQNNFVSSVSYNTQAKRGVLIGKVEASVDPITNETTYSQMLSIFDASNTAPYVTERTSNYFPVVPDEQAGGGGENSTTKIIKTEISDEGFIYALQANNKMVVYEAVDYYQTFTLSHKIVKRWEQDFTRDHSGKGGKTIHDFDLLDANYIVLYVGTNETYVYQIEMQIYWTYQMLLPLYRQYSMFSYFSGASEEEMLLRQNPIIRSSSGDYLVLLMATGDADPAQRQYMLFFYCFKSSQHDSLVMVQNVTEFYSQSKYQDVYLIGDGFGEAREVTLMSDMNLSLNDIRLKSSLVLTSDRGQLAKLIDRCSVLTSKVTEQGILEDLGGTITQMLIVPRSRFNNQTKEVEDDTNPIILEQFINLTIITQNQGLIAMPSQKPKIKVAYSGDLDDESINQLNNLYMQELVDGYNLTYDFKCSYLDPYGKVQDCLIDGGIDDQTANLPYTFWIEQVTSTNRVLMSFTINRLFFMFDSKHNINILSLHNDDVSNLDEINMYSLDSLRTFTQMDKLGCNVSAYAEHMELYQENDHYVNLLMYQCLSGNKITLKMATLTVYNRTNDSAKDDDNISKSIKNLTGQLDIAVPILDIEIYDYQQNTSEFKMIITTRINGSYQNLLLFYDAQIVNNQSQVIFIKDSAHYMSAVSTNRDTFKVCQVLIIPGLGTHLAIVALEDTGAIIIDTETKRVLSEYNIRKMNPFPDQTSQQIGPLQVFSLAGDWPYSFHILSNYGLYIFTFAENITDRQTVISNPQQVLNPLTGRVIQLYFDKFSYQLAANNYGYAFLVTRNSSMSNFDVFLGGVAFNAQQNSKILRMIKIAQNQECISLNQEPYLASSDEDQIAVSFVCDTQLFIVRLCMRPHFITNMSPFNQTATRRNALGQLEPGILQFSQFNITVNATNEFTNLDVNKGLITIRLDYEATKTQSQITMTMVYFTIIVLIIVSFLSLTYLSYRQQEMRITSKGAMRDFAANYQRASRYSQRTSRRYRSTYYTSSQRRSHFVTGTSSQTQSNNILIRPSMDSLRPSSQFDPYVVHSDDDLKLSPSRSKVAHLSSSPPDYNDILLTRSDAEERDFDPPYKSTTNMQENNEQHHTPLFGGRKKLSEKTNDQERLSKLSVGLDLQRIASVGKKSDKKEAMASSTVVEVSSKKSKKGKKDVSMQSPKQVSSRRSHVQVITALNDSGMASTINAHNSKNNLLNQSKQSDAIDYNLYYSMTNEDLPSAGDKNSRLMELQKELMLRHSHVESKNNKQSLAGGSNGNKKEDLLQFKKALSAKK